MWHRLYSAHLFLSCFILKKLSSVGLLMTCFHLVENVFSATINYLRSLITLSFTYSKRPNSLPLCVCLWKTVPHLLRRFRSCVIVSTPASPSCGASSSLYVLSQERRSALQYTLWLSLNQLFGAPAQEKTALGQGDVTDSKTTRVWSRVDGGAGGGGLDTAWHCRVWTEQLVDLAGPLTLSRSTKSQLLARTIWEECTVKMKQSWVVGEGLSFDCIRRFGWNWNEPFSQNLFSRVTISRSWWTVE